MQKIKEQLPIFFFAILFFTTVFIWYVLLREDRAGTLTVAFLDIGQGDSIYIEGPDGTQVIVDGGPDRNVLARLGEVMPPYDRSIDAVIATHPDKDHIAGLVDILSYYRVSHFFEPGIANDTAVYTALEKTVVLQGIPKTLARRGMRISLGDGAELQILFPDRDIESDDTNDASVVAEVRYGRTCFLLTGDAPTKTAESYILYTLADSRLPCDVLKLGHHGSKYSNGAAFLSVVAPSVAVISVGKDNRYGHPARETLERVETLGIPYLSTVTSGTILFKSDGEKIWQN